MRRRPRLVLDPAIGMRQSNLLNRSRNSDGTVSSTVCEYTERKAAPTLASRAPSRLRLAGLSLAFPSGSPPLCS